MKFPTHQDVDAVLRDGSTVHVRPVRPEDRKAVEQFLERLSTESRVFRFFAAVKDMSWAAERFVDVDYATRHSLVALRGEQADIVGHAYYAKSGPGRAEVALAIADPLQGMGLGTLLLGQLAQAAAAAGIEVFEAEIMPANHRMLEVFRQSGFQLVTRASQGVIEVEFPTALTEQARERFMEREQLSAIAALKHFFQPAAIAVVGASRRPGSIGGAVFRNLIESGFPGPVYPISPHPNVQSVAAYPDVRQVVGPIDLAVIVVPAAEVMAVAEACAEKGVKALLVISAGFSEAGRDGVARQARLLDVCREAGMRLIGPNCMGVINTAPESRLNATFAPGFPPTGNVGFLSQSGGLGLAVIDHARGLGLGMSTFVSVGNKADISGNDLLEYWDADDATRVVMLYMESFGNPRRFAQIARRLARRKPILAVKSGRSQAGARASTSHTGALLAASDITVDALFKQAGVIRADTLAELFDVASLLANQPPPPGRRVGILTNAGGPGILCADACVAGGLEVPELPRGTRAELEAFLPAEAASGNPVDMIASASAADFERAIRVLAECETLDSLVVIFIPPLVTQAADVAAALRRAASAMPEGKPLIAVFMSSQGVPSELNDEGVRIPSYPFPEDAARALARAAAWSAWRSRPEAEAAAVDGLRPDEARALISSALGRGGGWLSFPECAALLDCYGIPTARWRFAPSAAGAARAAAELGGAVAVKGVGASLLHKTEAGAVELRLQGVRRVLGAARAIRRRVRDAGGDLDGFLVQEMVGDGAEMIVGVVQDEVFGPLVACGMGGTVVELVRDVQVRLAPLAREEAAEMVRSLATFPILDGYRGRPKLDVAALEELILRVAAMVGDAVEIAELDLNPVFVRPQGAVAGDARIRIEERLPPPPEGARSRRRP